MAIVTGAGRGLGRATARRLAADGHHVVAVDLDGDAAARTAAEIGGTARRCDVSDAAQTQELGASLDGADILVNNAGIWRFADLLDITPEDARAVVEVNVLGVLYCTQAVVPHMIAAGGGAVVNLSSAAAFTNSPGVGIYPATKAAVISLTKQMALELGEHGIRVNAVGPGLVETEGTAPNFSGDRRAERARNVPLGRVGTPQDIADVVAFLVSDQARYVSGQILYADGGVSAGRLRI
jgi:NAD(P)-dependent dehydrogenase (short-subunit alcohol dehydrogenase family)